MHGHPVGQIRNGSVFKMGGNYVGELDDGMVVNKHRGNLGNIGSSGNPGNAGSPGNPGSRGASGSSYRDVFDQLLE